MTASTWPALGSLLTAAAAAGEIRADVEPTELLSAVSRLCSPARGDHAGDSATSEASRPCGKGPRGCGKSCRRPCPRLDMPPLGEDPVDGRVHPGLRLDIEPDLPGPRLTPRPRVHGVPGPAQRIGGL
ncbi:hypothetical protein [Streptomyces malaysiensis]|uniref:hypothetical protein n=1 Tax=Streptomyces malaysiensis TaxID=92644 RepID=UPI0036F1D4AD